MSNKTRITNVYLQGLIQLLTELSGKYELIDIIVCPEDKTVVIEPIELDKQELNDNNIYDLV